MLREFTRLGHGSALFLTFLIGMDCAHAAAMSTAKRFEDLIVWQLAVRIRVGVYALTESGPAATDFTFRDQIRDFAASAPRNISEGFLRYHPPEFAQFLHIARGSLGETQNHLLHGKEQQYLSAQEFSELRRLTCRVLRAANRLHAYLRRCGRKSARHPTTRSSPHRHPAEAQNLVEPRTL